jgi:E3 ubiquitin-protein ligase RFWD2
VSAAPWLLAAHRADARLLQRARSHLRVVAELPQSDVFHSSNIVSRRVLQPSAAFAVYAHSDAFACSIEFDKDNEFFATAGVSRRIKVFDFRAAIVACGDAPLLPVLELSTRSKLSCLSWSKSVKSQVASSNYEGVVSLWDTASGACVVEFEEVRARRLGLCGVPPR